MKTCLTHARVVLPGEVLENSAILIEDDVVRSIDPDGVSSAKEINMHGQTVMPGLIDLHCDALEKEVEPRPNVFFPLDFAVLQADLRNAQAGISTVFHALSFANEELGVRNNEMAADIVKAVSRYSAHGLVDNKVHCRYEISDGAAVAVVLDLLQDNAVQLVSVMDHTPGQGQFKDIPAYQKFLTETYKKTPKEADDIIQRKFERAKGAHDRVALLAHAARARKIRLASHDDDNPEKLDAMRQLGISISEFPVNIETARAAKERNIWTIFGAPNVLRGRSQSGSIKAADAISKGVADCLCSDYSPGTLLAAVFYLDRTTDTKLHEAARLVTANPAKIAGLEDRGEIAVGKQADLVAVHLKNHTPQVTSLWVKGKLVYQAVLNGK